MASFVETKVKCTSCAYGSVAKTYQSINVKNDPDLKAKVKDGSLFVWECPHCGRLNLLKYPVLYHDPDEKLMIWLIPEGISSSDTEAIEKGLENVPKLLNEGGPLDGYTLRRVSDIGSLIEKVNIFDAGLDDAVMEMCKYVTAMELREKGSDDIKGVSNDSFKFYKIEGPDNEISFSFPLDGKMHGVKTGFNVYEDCAGILRRNPSIKPDPGFARIDASWLSRFFK